MGNTYSIPNVLSIIIILLISFTSGIGILTPEFYSAETLNWRTQSIGQDIINVSLIVPALILCIILNIKGNKYSGLMMTGVHVYLLYTFTIYCFDVHFNKLFLIYCMVLGLVFYSTIYYIYHQIRSTKIAAFKNTFVMRVTGIYFIFIAVIFLLLWLSRILPSIANYQTPDELKDTGLLTNPVHVLDLAIILPAFFLTGTLVLKDHSLGRLLAPMLLMFALLMDLTIAALMIIMKLYDVVSYISVSVIMILLAIVTLTLLLLIIRKEPDSSR